jgi:hypothetical protein
MMKTASSAAERGSAQQIEISLNTFVNLLRGGFNQ